MFTRASPEIASMHHLRSKGSWKPSLFLYNMLLILPCFLKDKRSFPSLCFSGFLNNTPFKNKYLLILNRGKQNHIPNLGLPLHRVPRSRLQVKMSSLCDIWRGNACEENGKEDRRSERSHHIWCRSDSG